MSKTHDNLTKLGEVKHNPSKELEVFENPNPERNYTIKIETPEFTCLCPKTGQPDFATIKLEYIPNELCIELKSLKMYYWSFRNEGAFHEAITNSMLDDFVKMIDPRYMKVEAVFNVRGGVYTTVVAEHKGKDCCDDSCC
jgi:7-cyano-7-deazaguanine reductase